MFRALVFYVCHGTVHPSDSDVVVILSLFTPMRRAHLDVHVRMLLQRLWKSKIFTVTGSREAEENGWKRAGGEGGGS